MNAGQWRLLKTGMANYETCRNTSVIIVFHKKMYDNHTAGDTYVVRFLQVVARQKMSWRTLQIINATVGLATLGFGTVQVLYDSKT